MYVIQIQRIIKKVLFLHKLKLNVEIMSSIGSSSALGFNKKHESFVYTLYFSDSVLYLLFYRKRKERVRKKKRKGICIVRICIGKGKKKKKTVFFVLYFLFSLSLTF
jgi:hypothetical protein